MSADRANKNSPKPEGVRLSYERGVPGVNLRGWVTVRRYKGASIDGFPRICCFCLANTLLNVPVNSSMTRNRIIVPLCEQCSSHWRRRRIVLFGIHLVISLGICLLLVIFERRDLVSLVAYLGIVIGPSSIILVLLLEFYGYPVRVAMSDRGSDISKIYFKNNEYTKCLEDFY